jgi:hypothetical protein
VTSLSLLRRHVFGSPKDLTRIRIGRPTPLEQFGEPEIDNTRYEVLSAELASTARSVELLGVVLRGLKDHIVGLQVTMKDTPIVRMLDGFGDCRDETGRLPDRNGEGLLIQPVAESLTRAKSRGDETDRTDFTGFIDRDEIGVIELGSSKRFSNEPPTSFGAQEHLGTGYFESNVALKFRIVRQEDDAAAALSQLLAKLKPTDAMRPTGRARGIR